MEFKQAFGMILRSLALALVTVVFVLVCLEVIMPGSVLPFVNLVYMAPVAFFVSLLLVADSVWAKGRTNLVQLALGFGFGCVMLAFSVSVVGYSSKSQIGLVAALALCLSTWAYIQINSEFHN